MPKRPAPENPQHRRVSKRLRIQNALFPRFEELPTEIRLQIWLTAVHQATVDRSIHVEMHPFLHVTDHSCIGRNGAFCGQHGSCSTVLNVDNVDHKQSICMVEGYFSSPKMLPSPEDAISPAALASLSLACRESRTAVLELYPKVLRILKYRWSEVDPFTESRLVRCRPETDVLVIYPVPESLRLSNPGEDGWRDQNEVKMSEFPNNERQFSAFKEIVSSFQHVAICVSEEFPEFNGEMRQECISGDFWPQDRIWPDNDIIARLLFFKSLRHLYIWVDPVCWPYESWRDGARSNNVEDIESTIQGAEMLRRESLGFLKDYNDAVKAQNTHSVADDKHWVPQPELLEHIGYCFPESWFMTMRLRAFGFRNMPFDAATTDELKCFWLKHEKRQFRS